jgi:hypothetical protein
MKSESTSADEAESSPLRSLASLLIFIHLFCLAVAITANQAPSRLQERLLEIFRPYTQLLNFDVSFIRFDLTQETADDADHRIEYLLEGQDPATADNWVPLTAGIKGSDRRLRYQRLAALTNVFGARGDDATCAVFASAIGVHLAQQRQQPIDQLRLRLHLLQSPDQLVSANLDERNPNSARFYQELYRARVIDGGLAVQKVEDATQVAPTVRASGQPARRPESRSGVRGTDPAANPEPGANPEPEANPEPGANPKPALPNSPESRNN